MLREGGALIEYATGKSALNSEVNRKVFLSED